MKMRVDSVAVVVAHPDDEVLGCGGLISQFVQAGVEVEVFFFTDGVTSRRGPDSELSQQRVTRRAESLRAQDVLGYQKAHFLDFPDNELDTVSVLTLAQNLEISFGNHSPDLFVTHFPGDLNIDHRRLAQAVQVVARPQFETFAPSVWYFETLSSTHWALSDSKGGFQPNTFVGIESVIDLKIAALAAYESELRVEPHPRSIYGLKNLASWRGMEAGLKFAEAFEAVRQTVQIPQ